MWLPLKKKKSYPANFPWCDLQHISFLSLKLEQKKKKLEQKKKKPSGRAEIFSNTFIFL